MEKLFFGHFFMSFGCSFAEKWSFFETLGGIEVYKEKIWDKNEYVKYHI
jgi:hypothetical protein